MEEKIAGRCPVCGREPVITKSPGDGWHLSCSNAFDEKTSTKHYIVSSGETYPEAVDEWNTVVCGME